MEVLQTPDDARRWTYSLRSSGRSVGIVPTMGALHEGHLSLVRLSQQKCDATIATIYVNPTQFGPGEDLEDYPRDLDRDCRLLADEGVAAAFVPGNDDMYPEGFSTYVQPPEVAMSLEGVCRAGHFRGVTTVVMKLLHAVPATHAFFGRKDYQQWKVIEAMTRDLNVGVQIIAGPTVREADGLALSSRNQYLSADDRRRALLLSAALQSAADSAAGGQRKIDVLENVMRQTLLGAASPVAVSHPESAGPSLENPGVDRIDYATIVDAESLSPLAELDRPAVALIAALVGRTRLIDNREISPA